MDGSGRRHASLLTVDDMVAWRSHLGRERELRL
jgi:hypothetical protein